MGLKEVTRSGSGAVVGLASHLIFLGWQRPASSSTKQGLVIYVGDVGVSRCAEPKANRRLVGVCVFLEELRLYAGYSN